MWRSSRSFRRACAKERGTLERGPDSHCGSSCWRRGPKCGLGNACEEPADERQATQSYVPATWWGGSIDKEGGDGTGTYQDDKLAPKTNLPAWKKTTTHRAGETASGKAPTRESTWGTRTGSSSVVEVGGAWLRWRSRRTGAQRILRRGVWDSRQGTGRKDSPTAALGRGTKRPGGRKAATFTLGAPQDRESPVGES